MPLLLPPILSNATKPPSPLLLLESSSSATCLPLLRAISSQKQRMGTVVLVCCLYPPRSLLPEGDLPPNVRVLDRTERVPGYDEEWTDPRGEILDFVKDAPPGPLEVIVDSVDTLGSDLGSVSSTYTLLSSLLSLLKPRPAPSRLTLHILTSPTPSSLLPQLTHTRFSPHLTHLTAHPAHLLAHLASAYLTPPPPLSPPEKFWRVFGPLSRRQHEVERMTFGVDGAAEGGEGVVEVLARRRGVERVLEGWRKGEGPCALAEMESLKALFTRKIAQEQSQDPTHGVSFNLNLTPEQQESRARVPLPYAHEGRAPASASSGTIYYDPDSADDIDDDDPDEDLDI